MTEPVKVIAPIATPRPISNKLPPGTRPTLPIPSPLFGSATGAAKRVGLFELSPDFQRLLRYGRGVDTTRLVEEVGFSPRLSTVEAVEDYVAARGAPREEAA